MIMIKIILTIIILFILWIIGIAFFFKKYGLLKFYDKKYSLIKVLLFLPLYVYLIFISLFKSNNK
jgi:hypothetical protein